MAKMDSIDRVIQLLRRQNVNRAKTLEWLAVGNVGSILSFIAREGMTGQKANDLVKEAIAEFKKSPLNIPKREVPQAPIQKDGPMYNKGMTASNLFKAPVPPITLPYIAPVVPPPPPPMPTTPAEWQSLWDKNTDDWLTRATERRIELGSIAKVTDEMGITRQTWYDRMKRLNKVSTTE